MTAKIIDGKKTAKKFLDELKVQVEKLSTKPSLAVIIVGENPASKIYVKNKVKTARELGFNSILKELKEETTKEELLSVIEELNSDKNINGILLQLPLPKHLSEEDFLDKILSFKDVDGFSSYNAGKLFKGEVPYAIPCTPKGIISLLKEEKIELEGKTALVIGRSNIVGKPIGALLLKENATVIQAHSKTKNLSELIKSADIIVSATGRQNTVKGEDIKEGAVIIDVGIIRDENGKLRGDVDFDSCLNKASYITPVPGGVGPMTIANLMLNTYELFQIQQEAQK